MPTPADWLQFGALGLLAFVLAGCMSAFAFLARRALRALEQIALRMDRLEQALIVAMQPTPRSWLEQLRPSDPAIESMRPPRVTERRDTPVDNPRRKA